MTTPYDPANSAYVGPSATTGFEVTPELASYFSGGANAVDRRAIKNLWRGEDLNFGPLGGMRAPHGADVSLIEDHQGNFHYVPKSASSLQSAYRDSLLEHNKRVQGVGSLSQNYPTDVLKFSDPRFAWMAQDYKFPRFKWGGDRYRGAGGSPGYSEDQFTSWLENATGRNQLETPEGPVPIHEFMANSSKYGLDGGDIDPNWYQSLWQDHPIASTLGHIGAAWGLSRLGGAMARGPIPRVFGDMWRTHKARKVTDEINQLTKEKPDGWEAKVEELKKSPHLVESEEAIADRETTPRRSPGKYLWDLWWGGGNKMKGATIEGGGTPPEITSPDIAPETPRPADDISSLDEPPAPAPAPEPAPPAPAPEPAPSTPDITSPTHAFEAYTAENGGRFAASIEEFMRAPVAGSDPFTARITEAWNDHRVDGVGHRGVNPEIENLPAAQIEQRIGRMNDQLSLLQSVYTQLSDPAVFQSGKITAGGREFNFQGGSIAAADEMLDDLMGVFRNDARQYDADLVGNAAVTGQNLHEMRNPLFSDLTDVRGIHGSREGRAKYVGEVMAMDIYPDKPIHGNKGGQRRGTLSKYHDIGVLTKLYRNDFANWSAIDGLGGPESNPNVAREQALAILDDFFPYDAEFAEGHPHHNSESNIHTLNRNDPTNKLKTTGNDPFSTLSDIAKNPSHPQHSRRIEYMGTEYSSAGLLKIVEDVRQIAEKALKGGGSGGDTPELPTNPRAMARHIEQHLYNSSTEAGQRGIGQIRASSGARYRRPNLPFRIVPRIP